MTDSQRRFYKTYLAARYEALFGCAVEKPVDGGFHLAFCMLPGYEKKRVNIGMN